MWVIGNRMCIIVQCLGFGVLWVIGNRMYIILQCFEFGGSVGYW